MGERPRIDWAAVVASPEEGCDIPVGPRRVALDVTALTPPGMDDIERFSARLAALKAYRDAEMVRGEIVRMQRANERWERLSRLERQWTPEVHCLLDLAESVSPPDEMPDEFGDVEFVARDGWKVAIFYDCGGLDYIDHFTRPDGTVVDFWEWPEGTPGRNLLISWRGVGDYLRLKTEAA